MNADFQVEVSKADLMRVMTALNDLKKSKSHLKNAINRTATATVKNLKAETKQAYTLKGSGKSAGRTVIYRASPAHLDAVIKAIGRPLTLKAHYKTTAPKAGARADITRSGLKMLGVPGNQAFIPSAGKAAGLIVRRHTEKRFPLKVLRGNSVPKTYEKIWQGERGTGDVKDQTQKRLHDEILKEIERVMR